MVSSVWGAEGGGSVGLGIAVVVLLSYVFVGVLSA